MTYISPETGVEWRVTEACEMTIYVNYFRRNSKAIGLISNPASAILSFILYTSHIIINRHHDLRLASVSSHYGSVGISCIPKNLQGFGLEELNSYLDWRMGRRTGALRDFQRRAPGEGGTDGGRGAPS